MTSPASGGHSSELEAEGITEQLVQGLLSDQFPHWAVLPVRRALEGGNDQPHVPAR